MEEEASGSLLARIHLQDAANKKWIESNFDVEIAKLINQPDRVQMIEIDSSFKCVLFAIYDSLDTTSESSSSSSLLTTLQTLFSNPPATSTNLFVHFDLNKGVEIVDENQSQLEEIEIDETEALALLDKEEDPLLVCRRLFFSALPEDSTQETSEHILPIGLLYKKGYFIVDNFVSKEVAEGLRKVAMEQVENKFLKPAGDIGADASFRSDLHGFLHKSDPLLESNPFLAKTLESLENLGHLLSKHLRLRKKTPQYQLAVYPADSTRYERHRDAYPEDGAEDETSELESEFKEEENDEEPQPWRRRLTALLYCNDGWVRSHGGELRMWCGPTSFIDVEPLSGRLIVFLSGAIEHEVRPAHQFRVAYTAWYS